MSVGDVRWYWRCLDGDLGRYAPPDWIEHDDARISIPSLEEDVCMIEWKGDGPPQMAPITSPPREPRCEVKPRFDLIPDGIERAVAMVFAATAKERDGDEPGWRTRPNERDASYAALRRHLDDYRAGVTADKDTGQHPLAHVIARAMILFDLENR